jgi:hypothetical protein
MMEDSLLGTFTALFLNVDSQFWFLLLGTYFWPIDADRGLAEGLIERDVLSIKGILPPESFLQTLEFGGKFT